MVAMFDMRRAPPAALVARIAFVCLLGGADDIWELDWFTKLIGQVLGGLLGGGRK